jgi:hypothetical protein
MHATLLLVGCIVTSYIIHMGTIDLLYQLTGLALKLLGCPYDQ